MRDLGGGGGEESAFVPVAQSEERVLRASPEMARSGYRTFRGADGFEAAIPEDVVARVKALGRSAAPREWHGLVIGQLYEDLGRTHVVVRGVVPDESALASSGYVETTPEGEWKTRTLAHILYPDCLILGWIHGHVRVGARFSATDRRTQTTWKQPHALGIVVDPWDLAELGVYRGPEAELLTSSWTEVETRIAASGDGQDQAEEGDPGAQAPKKPRFSKLRTFLGAALGATALTVALMALAIGVSTRSALERALLERGKPATEKRSEAEIPSPPDLGTPGAPVAATALPFDAGLCALGDSASASEP